MPYSAANTRIQRRLQLDLANHTSGGAIQALGVADPNTGGVSPVARTLGFGTDSSLWVSNGTTWSNIASGGGGTHYNDNVYLSFGTTTYYTLGYGNTLGPYALTILGTTLTGAGGSGDAHPLLLISQSTTTTSAGGGKNSASIGVQSGEAAATGAGTTGGNSGSVGLLSGNATSAAGGTSGNSGTVSLQSGSSADGNSGDVTARSGDGGVDSGNVDIGTGNGGTGRAGNVKVSAGTNTGGDSGVFSLEAPLISPNGADFNSVVLAPLLTKATNVTDATVQTFTLSRNGTAGTGRLLDILLVKKTAPGAAGDTITVATTLGTWVSIDLNGVAANTVIRLGDAAVTADLTKASIADGTAVTVTPTEASSVDCLLVLYFLNA